MSVARSGQVCIYWLWKHCLLLSILFEGRANAYRHKKASGTVVPYALEYLNSSSVDGVPSVAAARRLLRIDIPV
jgi:hypothetical protein